MNTPEFDIIFRGDIVFGHQLAEVKLKLQQLFKVDAAKVDALFAGRPIPLKRNLDEATAQKYREVLFKAGAQVEICASSRESAKPSPTSSSMIRPAAPTWSIAPSGADLLPADQRPAAPISARIDLTGLSLRAQSGNLLDANEVATPPVNKVQVPNLLLAELGATLSDERHLSNPLADIELADWTLADVGADLLNAEERVAAAFTEIPTPDFDLALPGSDLGQIKPQTTPLNPDISGLRLIDPNDKEHL